MKWFFVGCFFLAGVAYGLGKWEIAPWTHYEAITLSVPDGPCWLQYPDGRKVLLRDGRITTRP